MASKSPTEAAPAAAVIPLSAANCPLSPGFVCSTPGSRPSLERVGKTGVDPQRTLAEQSLTLFMRPMPRGARHGRDRLGEQSYEPLGRLLDSFTPRA